MVYFLLANALERGTRLFFSSVARYYRRDFRTPTLADAWDFMGPCGIDGDSIMLATDYDGILWNSPGNMIRYAHTHTHIYIYAHVHI